MPETALTFGTLQQRLEDVRRRIDAAATRSRRSASDVTLIAVSKTHAAALVKEAVAAGLADFGENRVQEAATKIEQVGRRSGIRWHLIGHLQANKARRAVKLFDVIHSVDSVELAQRLDRLCAEEGRNELPVFAQVHLGHEETKEGVSEQDLPSLATTISAASHLRLLGLMAVPPFFAEPEGVRPYFVRLRELRDMLGRGLEYYGGRGELSMGMSHDFEVAIEEGATVVRVGTAIFGERERIKTGDLKRR